MIHCTTHSAIQDGRQVQHGHARVIRADAVRLIEHDASQGTKGDTRSHAGRCVPSCA